MRNDVKDTKHNSAAGSLGIAATGIMPEQRGHSPEPERGPLDGGGNSGRWDDEDDEACSSLAWQITDNAAVRLRSPKWCCSIIDP